MARRYKHQSEELHNTLSAERSSWQTKLDEIQQGGSKIPIDLYERKKLIEQGRQEQKTETESLISELMAKVSLKLNLTLNDIHRMFYFSSWVDYI